MPAQHRSHSLQQFNGSYSFDRSRQLIMTVAYCTHDGRQQRWSLGPAPGDGNWTAMIYEIRDLFTVSLTDREKFGGDVVVLQSFAQRAIGFRNRRLKDGRNIGQRFTRNNFNGL